MRQTCSKDRSEISLSLLTEAEWRGCGDASRCACLGYDIDSLPCDAPDWRSCLGCGLDQPRCIPHHNDQTVRTLQSLDYLTAAFTRLARTTFSSSAIQAYKLQLYTLITTSKTTCDHSPWLSLSPSTTFPWTSLSPLRSSSTKTRPFTTGCSPRRSMRILPACSTWKVGSPKAFQTPPRKEEHKTLR